jgi:hypothetical protein
MKAVSSATQWSTLPTIQACGMRLSSVMPATPPWPPDSARKRL